MVRPSNAQILSSKEIEKLKTEATEIIEFFAFQLNTLADANADILEKEIIIYESYLRIFDSKNVQIEDDLIEDRNTIINKVAQDYLRDVMFFFNEAKFDFTIHQITENFTENGDFFLKVELTRSLIGVDKQSKSFNWNKIRFIELNYNQKKQSLAIASIYSTPITENEELANWFNNLSEPWKKIFAQRIQINDTLSLFELMDCNPNNHVVISVQEYSNSKGDTLYLSSPLIFENLKKLLNISSLNLNGQKKISSLTPLIKLKKLEKLNLSETEISSIDEIGALPNLKHLDLSSSCVYDISVLRFLPHLTFLNISNTEVYNLSPIDFTINLKQLIAIGTKFEKHPTKPNPNLFNINLSESNLKNYSFISIFKNIEHLDLSHSTVNDLNFCSTLSNLKSIYLQNTEISCLKALKDAPKLIHININYSKVLSLNSIFNLPALKTIYCEKTALNQSEIKAFTLQNPSVLVIFNSDFLINWWENLDSIWKDVFREILNIKSLHTKEQLHSLVAKTSLNLSGNKNITNLYALIPFYKLKNLDISITSISDISTLTQLNYLEELNLSQTLVNSIDAISNLSYLKKLNIAKTNVLSVEPLQALKNLNWLNASDTPINTFSPLLQCENLKYLEAENTSTEENKLIYFALNKEKTEVIFRTEALMLWWNNLPDVWRNWFIQTFKISPIPAALELQKINMLNSLNLSNQKALRNLIPLMNFPNLKYLDISKTGLSELSPLKANPSLLTLNISDNPITDISALSSLKQLREIKLNNTPIQDISALSKTQNLRDINLSGSQVRTLKPLEGLILLENIDVSNSAIKRIDYLENCKNLKNLICFNTRLNQKRIDAFKIIKPNVSIIFY